jgi:hypothetical protein
MGGAKVQTSLQPAREKSRPQNPLGMLGAGREYSVLLPFSRMRELEAESDLHDPRQVRSPLSQWLSGNA